MPPQRSTKVPPTHIQTLKQRLTALPDYVELSTKNQHEYHRCQVAESTVIIYKSGSVVYNDHPAVEEALGGATTPPIPKNHSRSSQAVKTKELDEERSYDFIIGQDEAGKGEPFGSLVVAAVVLTPDQAQSLATLGIRDSKKTKKKDLPRRVEQIRAGVVYQEVVKVGPERFDELLTTMREEGKNLNHLLAWAHARVLENVLTKLETQLRGKRVLVIVDQFDKLKMDAKVQKLLGPNLTFVQRPKADETAVSVAAASNIAKQVWNVEIAQVEQEIKLKLRWQNIRTILSLPGHRRYVKRSFVTKHYK